MKILVHNLDRKKDGSSDFIMVVLNKNLTVNFVILNHLNRLKFPSRTGSSVAQADELLADFPQFSRFLSVAGFLRQSVLERSRVLVPAPVNSRFCQARIAHNLSQSLSRFFLRHIAFGDELLEWREKQPEQRNVLPEQPRGGDAAGVQGGEGDAGFLVVTTVELLHCEHVADLAVLVGLGAVKVSPVDHGGGVQPVQAALHPSQVPQIRLGRYIPSQRIGVPCDRAHDDKPLGWIIGLNHVIKQQS